ncbi:MAG: type II toxin-antitoxin system RelE/ParE family toxin [Deltaproteobacteria bacterium]|nr:type II toxin-antitoxin system RelE/ParE family toxin [Deltaproteobacteria bacterium]
MPAIVYSSRALGDLERLAAFLVREDHAGALEAMELIVDAVRVLERHPYMGRIARGELRELVISRGRTGYVALYRVAMAKERIEILAVRYQREAGYS